MVKWLRDNFAKAFKAARPLMPSIVGLASHAAICVGVWGLAGWEWGAIGAGLPPFALYLVGEWRSARAE